MSDSTYMTPLSQVMKRLEEKGYGAEFRTKKDKGAVLDEGNKTYSAEDLKIVKVYRFEGESDPADMAILYAIQAKDGKHGYLLDAYGTYSDEEQQYHIDFIKKVPADKDERLDDID
ncbi:hypothetical protein [Litoribacter populi]|uniref:hypothetical protein n=1 Tax=Litoribacter populi TaxID=2598460 RepID=UPI00117F73EA|nr:hypothetical protein [Litoribacter populi]